jgi:hypothetical protein
LRIAEIVSRAIRRMVVERDIGLRKAYNRDTLCFSAVKIAAMSSIFKLFIDSIIFIDVFG